MTGLSSEPHALARQSRETLVQQVQHRLVAYIQDHGLAPGSPLPTEAELSASLGISRPSLREAIRALRAIGVVESRQGVGTFVGRTTLGPLEDVVVFNIQSRDERETQRSIADLLELREVLETHLVRYLVHDLTEDDFRDLDAILDRMAERAARGEMVGEEDQAFHTRLYAGSHNRLVLELVSSFWRVSERIQDKLPPMGVELEEIVEQHRAIVRALRARDTDRTVLTMTDHFAPLRSRVAEMLGQRSPGPPPE